MEGFLFQAVNIALIFLFGSAPQYYSNHVVGGGGGQRPRPDVLRSHPPCVSLPSPLLLVLDELMRGLSVTAVLELLYRSR